MSTNAVRLYALLSRYKWGKTDIKYNFLTSVPSPPDYPNGAVERLGFLAFEKGSE
jgi:hypothetical protein